MLGLRDCTLAEEEPVVETSANVSKTIAAHRRAVRLRTSSVAVLAVVTLGLVGCGDPDDDDGDSGGGYVAAHLTVPVPGGA